MHHDTARTDALVWSTIATTLRAAGALAGGAEGPAHATCAGSADATAGGAARRRGARDASGAAAPAARVAARDDARSWRAATGAVARGATGPGLFAWNACSRPIEELRSAGAFILSNCNSNRASGQRLPATPPAAAPAYLYQVLCFCKALRGARDDDLANARAVGCKAAELLQCVFVRNSDPAKLACMHVRAPKEGVPPCLPRLVNPAATPVSHCTGALPAAAPRAAVSHHAGPCLPGRVCPSAPGSSAQGRLAAQRRDHGHAQGRTPARDA